MRQGRNGLGGSSSVVAIEDDGVSGGGKEVDSTIGAIASEEEVLDVVYAVGIDDGAFEVCRDDRFGGRVSGIDAPVYFAE